MKKVFLVVLGAVLLLGACSDDDAPKNARLVVNLTDAPGDYEEVIINVQDVKINASNEDEGGWMSMSEVNKGEYNLLDFTNGMDTLLAEQELPAVKVSQMRLVLGDGNKVKIDGQYYDLDTPSASQSGLKFNIHADLAEGVTYKLWIDFDAARSIVKKGNGSYSLKPVIRTYTEATSGAIKGAISPVEAKPYVMAISAAQDTVGTYADLETGKFLIKGIDEGTYKVEIVPAKEYQKKEIENVEVVIGETTDLEIIELEAVTE
ncbi:DUF4382 domain-containing protein [Marinilabiliaceae bacterium JC017]|nr:DUF4382 domain-containing protein [Marinilabiliaceae bacterium JC017]